MQKNASLQVILFGLLVTCIPNIMTADYDILVPHIRYRHVRVVTPPSFNPALSMLQAVASAVSIASVGYSCYHCARALKYWLLSSNIHDEREDLIREEASESAAKVFGGLGVGLISGIIANSNDSLTTLQGACYALWGYTLFKKR